MNASLKNAVRLLARHSALAGKLAYRQTSFSQEGEDRLLLRYFGRRQDGFYLDVGAHHPFRFSNTALFHRRGWRGINVDAWPGCMVPFRRARPRDINLEIGVAKEAAAAPFYIFNDPAMNTFDSELAQRHNRAPWFIERTVQVPLRPLFDILDEHLPTGQAIDFASIDVEGKDLEVLESNDWTRYRPEMLLVELIGGSLAELSDDPIAKFLLSQGYAPYAKTVNTLFFLRSD